MPRSRERILWPCNELVSTGLENGSSFNKFYSPTPFLRRLSLQHSRFRELKTLLLQISRNLSGKIAGTYLRSAYPQRPFLICQRKENKFTDFRFLAKKGKQSTSIYLGRRWWQLTGKRISAEASSHHQIKNVSSFFRPRMTPDLDKPLALSPPSLSRHFDHFFEKLFLILFQILYE